MLKNNNICAVVPAFNEEKTIRKVLKELSFVDYIIVVDDGSTDKTKKIAEKYANVYVNSKNRGYEYSITLGLRKAIETGADIIFTTDADGEVNIEDVKKGLDLFVKNKLDILIGFQDSKYKRISEIIFSFYTKLMFGIKDPLCAFKVYGKKMYPYMNKQSNKYMGSYYGILGFRKKFKREQIYIKVFPRDDVPKIGGIIKGNVIIFCQFIKFLIGGFYDE